MRKLSVPVSAASVRQLCVAGRALPPYPLPPVHTGRALSPRACMARQVWDTMDWAPPLLWRSLGRSPLQGEGNCHGGGA